MSRVAVYEHLSAAPAPDPADVGAAQLHGEGLAMRDALLADLRAAGGVDARVLLAPAHEDAAALLARAVAGGDLAWVVAPETGGVLAGLALAVPPAQWLGCAHGAIVTASSKRLTLQRLAEHGLCTPLLFETAAQTRRWVVKPDDGVGARHTHIHRSHAAAAADAAQRERDGQATVLEAWVEGHALSLSMLCGPHGAELLSVNRQHVVTSADGTVRFDGVEPNVLAAADPRSAPLHALARGVADAISGLRGFVGVDFVWHAQRGPVVIEVNPRMTSAYVGLSAALGRNLAAEVVAAHRAEFGGASPGGAGAPGG